MAQTQWTDYLKLLRQLTETVEQLAEVERQKAGAASRGDVAGVDECMKREQVLSLSLRGIDQKRDKMIEQLGLRGVPLRDLVEHSPEGLEVETRRVADTLRQQSRRPPARHAIRWRSTCGPLSFTAPSGRRIPPRRWRRAGRPISGRETER